MIMLSNVLPLIDTMKQSGMAIRIRTQSDENYRLETVDYINFEVGINPLPESPYVNEIVLTVRNGYLAAPCFLYNGDIMTYRGIAHQFEFAANFQDSPSEHRQTAYKFWLGILDTIHTVEFAIRETQVSGPKDLIIMALAKALIDTFCLRLDPFVVKSFVIDYVHGRPNPHMAQINENDGIVNGTFTHRAAALIAHFIYE